MITEQDFRRKFPTANPATLKSPINERLLQQAVVDAALLTGHPGWDKYLTLIQAELDTARHALTAEKERIGGAYRDEDLRMVQGNIRELSGRIAAFEHCLSLPTQLVQEAKDHGLLAGQHD